MNPAGLDLLRARLSLPALRRVSGLLEGRHRSLLHGHGEDFDDLTRYAPGDDVSDIDWKASAGAGVPLIKRYLRDASITVVLAVDTGRAMAARSAGGEPKSAVAIEIARLVALLAHDGSDRVALVAADAGRVLVRPGRSGRAHTQTVIRLVERAFDPRAPLSDVPGLLDRVGRTFPRRGLVVVITDEAHPDADHDPATGEGPDAAALRRLRARHDVIVLSVADADPLNGEALGAEAPGGEALGREALAARARVDVEDGWTVPPELLDDPALREAVAAHATARAARRREALLRARVPHAVVPGSHDVLVRLAEALTGARRVR